MTEDTFITPQRADALISNALPADWPTEYVPITSAAGRILRRPVPADRDLPPFDRVMMDGIALASAALGNGNRRFKIESTALPGRPPLALSEPASGCIQVMTGAVLPQGCDTVVPFEEIKISGDYADIAPDLGIEAGDNVHHRASDLNKGDILLPAGKRLTPNHIALAASTGQTEVCVARPPRIAVVSNGDELVDLGHPVHPFQIRPINNYGIRAVLHARAFPEVHVFHTPDDRDAILTVLNTVLDNFDLLIISGGVSMGRFDYVPSVLQELGVQKIFHKVRERPGKPLWFGMFRNNKPVFALPGNPVSSMVCLHRYVLPHTEHAMGLRQTSEETAVLARPVDFEPPLTFFPPVKTSVVEGILTAEPVKYNNSGHFAALSESNGFIELQADINHFPAGTSVPFRRWTSVL